MIVFGLLSTSFDLITFALLRFGAHADPELFRTAWFVLSLLTQLTALFVLRTRRRFWRSKPSRLLLWSAVFVAIVALSLPYSGAIAALFAFQPVPAWLLGRLLLLVLAYAACIELAKRQHPLQSR
jgi:Mg2+-importing ATPase